MPTPQSIQAFVEEEYDGYKRGEPYSFEAALHRSIAFGKTLSEFALIPLTRGVFTVVDKEDEERINNLGYWQAKDCGGKLYACRNGSKDSKETRLARFLLGAPEGMEVDHINGLTLDNRKINLRVCTHSENICNRSITKTNTSGYIGVAYSKRRGKWQAQIQKDNKKKFLGYFDTKEEAHAARKKAEEELHGEFAAKSDDEIKKLSGKV